MSQPLAEGEHGSPPSTPRWVKIAGVIILVLAVLLGVMLLSGGEHGPGRHLPASIPSEQTPAVGVTQVHTPPIDHSPQQP